MRKTITIAIIGMLVICLSGCGANRSSEVNDVTSNAPKSLKVVCDDILVRIDGPKMWTLSRIEYKGILLGIEDSAYGTVLEFPGIGLIGSAHKQDCPDGEENVQLLEFYLDGKRVIPSQDIVTGTSFKLVKRSSILGVTVENITEISHNLIYETAIVGTTEETPLKLAYHFMHAWTPKATAFLACSADGKEIYDEFKDSDGTEVKHYTIQDMEWVAVYDAASGTGVVSRLLQRPSAGGATFLLVDAPDLYRKCYVMSFEDMPMPAGFNGKYEMVTGFFESPPSEWPAEARRLSERLK